MTTVSMMSGAVEPLTDSGWTPDSLIACPFVVGLICRPAIGRGMAIFLLALSVAYVVYALVRGG